MVIIIATLWLIGTFFMCIFSFWAGRCARKLPIIDDKLPWTMSRDQAVRYTEDRPEQDSPGVPPPCWPGSR